MTREDLVEASENDDMLFLTEKEYDKALIGWMYNSEYIPVALYSRNKLIQVMINEFNMTEEEALDYYGYNVENTYMGENTPMYADTLDNY